jgi:hypothetical protein
MAKMQEVNFAHYITKPSTLEESLKNGSSLKALIERGPMSDRREHWRDGNARPPESPASVGWEAGTDGYFKPQSIQSRYWCRREPKTDCVSPVNISFT